MNIKTTLLTLTVATILSACLPTPNSSNTTQTSKPKTPDLSYECKIQGKVVKVVDGDTAYVLDATNTQHKIRFAGMDAPERGQAYGKKATNTLKGWIAAKQVCVDYEKTDRWQRKIGTIVYQNKNINLAMVQAGYGWHYKKYQREQTAAERKAFAQAEQQARNAKLGLWADPHAQAPWEYRKAKRNK